MRVIGTAGHVDHGKSALVKALTGMDPDRLKEEKERKMTIDLGFAWGQLPGGAQFGFVDVPGHRDFIENMLAGVGGIDAVLFVVAADEGVMPQTREHLAILDLLNVKHGVVALTKIDLASDEEWLALVEEDVQRLLAGTALAEAPIVRVSAKTMEGLEALLSALEIIVERTPAPDDVDRPRLPIDRAFTISGFGTVVTGTLLDGKLQTGLDVQILPGGAGGRIRGLQTHKEDVETALPGSRVAVNVSGLEVGSVARGDVLLPPGEDRASRRLIVKVRVLESSPSPLEHNQQVKLFVGAAQQMARVRAPRASSLLPGEQGFVELRLERPVLARRGDRFILRRPSPPTTLAGGLVADPHPHRRYRFDDAEIGRLSKLVSGERQSIVLAVLRGLGPTTVQELAQAGNLGSSTVQQALERLVAVGDAMRFSTEESSGPLYVEISTWRKLMESVFAILSDYHRQFRLRSGMPMEELKTRLGWSERVYAVVIDRLLSAQKIQKEGGRVRLTGFEVRLTSEESEQVRALMAAMGTDPFAPPDPDSLRAIVGPEVYTHLVSRGDLVPVSEDVVFSRSAYQAMVQIVVDALDASGPMTVAQLRDALDTSRKYTLALLEHMDQIGWTVRKGDVRELIRRPGN